MLVANSSLGDFELPGFNRMVVDGRTGLRTLVEDILDGKMQVQQLECLMIFLGRADVLNNEDMEWVLARLRNALLQMEFQGKLVLVGPIPVVHDRPWKS